jgi:peptidoglycan/xylan/chitin deacetylase (PgdA/CDA1 family)
VADAAIRRDLPVLTYHSIDNSGSPVSIAPREFRRHMDALAAAGWRTIDVDTFLRGRRDGGWPARTFVLTFDDGYRNLLDEALPVMAACGFTGVVFAATDRVGGTMIGPDEPSWTPASPLLDWDGLRAMAAAGWSIASHAVTHRRLPSLAPAEVARELAESRARIEHEIGAAARALAYPYGDASPDVERLAGERYDAAFGTTLGFASASTRATNIERIDAYYLRGQPVAHLDGAPLRLYLAVRRAGRAIRRPL